MNDNLKKEIKISGIFYMGNKKKLIKKGLIDLFPKNINMFVDLFGGSGIVTMNTKANKYILNDIDENLFKLYEMFKDYDSEKIINHIENSIDYYGLPRERTKRNVFKDEEKLIQYKTAYINLRDNANKTKDILDLYTCIYFAFSQTMRFNSKGDFNMPTGNDCFTSLNAEYIKNTVEYFKNVKIFNKDFREIKINNLFKNDFVYMDIPYLNTTATYNENDGWSIQDDYDVFELCEELNSKNIKWGMSNVFENKGKINQHLIDWCNKNNWNVYTFDKHSYSACGKGNSNAKEVYICNYIKENENEKN